MYPIYNPSGLFFAFFSTFLPAVSFLFSINCYLCRKFKKLLLRFFVNGVLFAERTILAHFESVRIVFLIFVIVVISLLAFGARQSDSGSTSFCHIFRLPKKLTPPRSANLFYTTFGHLSIIFYYIL